MKEQSIDINNIFSSIATKYDRLNTILTLNIDQLWRKRAIKLANINENDNVLDICCGTGKMIELECHKVGPRTIVTGLDFNKEMLKVGKRKLSQSITGYQFNLIQGDACALPFKDNSFDCITIAFGLRNIPDKNKAVIEMYRVLKPGGKIVCLELSKPEFPIFKYVYNLYFNYILPAIGYLGTKDKQAYYYLRDSVNGFMSKQKLLRLFRKTGFNNTKFKSLSFGIASIHYGIKPLQK